MAAERWYLAAGAGAVVGVVALLRHKAAQLDLSSDGNSPSLPKGATNPRMNGTIVQESLPWDKRGLGRTFELSAHTEMPQHALDRVWRMDVPSLRTLMPSTDASLPHPNSYPNFISEENIIIADIVRKPKHSSVTRAYVRAGPRRTLYQDPATTTAAIVTCGGLCPGLNNIVREVTRTLILQYGVKRVIGVADGYNGFDDAKHPIVPLTLEGVRTVHDTGGTILGAARGGFHLPTIKAFLVKHGVTALFVIGGDGTHRGALKLSQACVDWALPVSVVGIPKTIDNDCDCVDRSFGFTTAVQEAVKAIKSAAVEARSAPHCIGLVKLMGRHAGFIAAHATLASGDPDLCLIPEVRMPLEGDTGVMTHLRAVLARQGHAVVVVAEGAGAEYLAPVTNADGSLATDAGGNSILPEVGPWLKRAISEHFEGQGLEPAVSVKYIDPSYIIRSVPANASDSLYCLLLAQNAVHGAMAGFTGFSVGLYNNRMVYLPMQLIVANSPRVMNPLGRTWERVVSVTGQPSTAVSLADLGMFNSTAKTVF